MLLVQFGTASRAWYGSSVDSFRTTSAEEILGTLAANSGFDIALAQRDAWRAQIDFLRERLGGLTPPTCKELRGSINSFLADHRNC